MRQHVSCPVDLKTCSGRLPGIFGTDRQGCEQLTHRFDSHKHQIHGSAAQCLQLIFRLQTMNKIPDEHLEQHFVGGIEEFRETGRQRILDEIILARIAWRANVRRYYRTRWLKTRVLLLELLVFLHNLEEFAVMCLAPITLCSLSLLDDSLDGFDCRREIGDRYQFGPAKILRGGLRSAWTDENLLLAVLLNQVPESLLDTPVEMAHRRKVLAQGYDLVIVKSERNAGFGSSQHL